MHNFNLVRIIGLLLTGVGSLCLCFLLPIIVRRMIRYNETVDDPLLLLIVFLGVAYFIIGIATMLKKKWTRVLINYLLFASIMTFLYLFFEEFDPRDRERFVVWAFSIMILMVFVSGILYINNDKVLADYDKEEEDLGYLEDEILDM